MASNTPLPDLSAKAKMELADYAEKCATAYIADNVFRSRLETADHKYARTLNLNTESERARIANRYGDATKLQNVIVPVVMPQVESALGYLTEIFLSGNPIFAISSEPDKQDVALMYNTIIEDSSIRGAWKAEFIKFFRDGLKYNLHAMEVDWCTKKVFKLETDLDYLGGMEGKKKQISWQGNALTRCDPYNTFFDWRVPPHKVHSEGEFVGEVRIMSKIALRRYLDSLPMVYQEQARAGYESGFGGKFYVPQINQDALRPSAPKAFDWLSWVQDIPSGGEMKLNYKNAYEVMVLYVRLIPSEFGIVVPARNSPQIWKLIVVNNKHLVYAERQTNAHDFLGIVVGQPINDGLYYQTKSFADNIGPFQDIASSLWNAKLASARRRLTDRMLFDPQRIRLADINSPEPNAKIPVRQSAYGRPLQEAVFQIPFDDANSQFFVQEANAVIDMSYFASGQNRVSQGQFQKGNKTLHEFDTVMGNAGLRDKLMAQFIEDQTMAPIKEMIKLNILQYQPGGELYSRVLEKPVKIDPVKLRELSAEFKVSDGMTPVERMMGTEEYAIAMQTIQAVPALQQGYRVVPMFSYIMKLRGLDHLKDFEKPEFLTMYEQQVASWQVVASEAAAAGQPIPPQPKMPPELEKFLQMQLQKQSGGDTEEVSDEQQATQQAQAAATPQL